MLGTFGAGLRMAGFGGAYNKDLLLDAGLGLAAQSAAMMLFDFFAESRARTYQRQIQEYGSGGAPR